MRLMMLGLITLSLGTGGAAASAQAASAAPGWMAGCWLQEKADRWTEECWMEPRGGIMLGSGRSGQGDKVSEWEATQILPGPDGRLAYWASPDGSARTAFPIASSAPNEIVFADPKHDYPQRIRYWRDGETLNAELSLMDGSQPMRWSYRRVQ